MSELYGEIVDANASMKFSYIRIVVEDDVEKYYFMWVDGKVFADGDRVAFTLGPDQQRPNKKVAVNVRLIK